MKLIWQGGDWYQRRIRPERRLVAAVYDKVLMLAIIFGKGDTLRVDSESVVFWRESQTCLFVVSVRVGRIMKD